MTEKVSLFYEGQDSRLALRCGIRMTWDRPNGPEALVQLMGHRWSDSPNEAYISLLEQLGHCFINLSKESERHEARALELEAHLGDALRSAEMANDASEERELELTDKDRELVSLRQKLEDLLEVAKEEHEELKQLREKVRIYQASPRSDLVEENERLDSEVKDLKRQLQDALQAVAHERDEQERLRAVQRTEREHARLTDKERDQLAEQVRIVEQQHKDVLTQAQNQWNALNQKGLELLQAEDRIQKLEVRLLDQETFVERLKELVVAAGVVINASKKVE